MVSDRSAYDATYQHAGEECSSTNEGRYVSIYEDLLSHPWHDDDDDLIEKGDPCMAFPNLVGIAMKTAESTEEVITIDTEGIWWLNVEAGKAWGDVYVGQMLYIDASSAAITDDYEQIPFGLSLGHVDEGNTTLIAVKVHAFQWGLWWWWMFPPK